MDKATAIKLLRGGPDGVKAWNAERPADRSGHLHAVDLSELDLSECDLRDADLRNVSLANAILVDADLRMVDLRSTILSRADLTRADMRGANCMGTSFSGATLAETRIAGAVFKNATFEERAVLQDLDAESSELPTLGAKHSESPGMFQGARFSEATIQRSRFSRLDFSGANFYEAELEEVSFHESRLRGAVFRYASLGNVDFGGATLFGAQFAGAELLKCDLQGVIVDQATQMSTVVNIQNTKIDRFTLLTLIGQGVLSEGQRMVMDIHDDVAKLRLAFGGFYRWLHLVSLTMFLAPFVWFVVFHHVRAYFAEPGAPSIPLAIALWRYILTGGRSWATAAPIAWGPVTLFAVALFYNLIRFFMLWITASLEHKEQVTTLPQRWNLRDHPVLKWGFRIAKWGVVLFALIAAGNLAYYLWNPIPVPHGVMVP